MTSVFPGTKSCAFHYLPQCAPKFCPMEGSRFAGPCSHKHVSAQDSADLSSSTSHVYRENRTYTIIQCAHRTFLQIQITGFLLSSFFIKWRHWSRFFPHLLPWTFPSYSTSLATSFPLLRCLHIFRIAKVITKAFTWLISLKCGQQNPTGIECKVSTPKACFTCRAWSWSKHPLVIRQAELYSWLSILHYLTWFPGYLSKSPRSKLRPPGYS